MAEKPNLEHESYRSFGERITAVESTVNGLKEDMQTIAKSVKEVAEKLDVAGKPSWGPILTFVSIAIGVIFYFSDSYQDSIDRLETKTTQSTKDIIDLKLQVNTIETLHTKEKEDRLLHVIEALTASISGNIIKK